MMSEHERDKLLYDAEVMCMRNKENCKTEKRRKLYGVASIAIHKDRSYLLTNIDKDAGKGFCSCGKTVSIIDGTFYCKHCGQRLSSESGWSTNDYYGENITTS